MKKLLIGLVATSSLVFGAGCGGDEEICEDFADAFTSLSKKVDGCPEISPFISDLRLGEEEINQCKESLSSCTDADKDKIRGAADCISGVSQCRSANLEAWANELERCLNFTVSEGCGGVDDDE
ncbi:putative lipoprotein [Myxococcus hansupus]|uniref:Putative lipoprotein n=1 Tax=Pseudomyxococcus hansupus TaxID=1297742 RepID=A0A0H4WYT2_9BACT|nr:hypothetical protein [Myxococcus hansupus]AKQ68601.1 putative lipoprotein [Myxococcus hansupus]